MPISPLQVLSSAGTRAPGRMTAERALNYMAFCEVMSDRQTLQGAAPRRNRRGDASAQLLRYSIPLY